jgi:hypothetical protein
VVELNNLLLDQVWRGVGRPERWKRDQFFNTRSRGLVRPQILQPVAEHPDVQPQVIEFIAVGQGDLDLPDIIFNGIQPLQKFGQLCRRGLFRMPDVDSMELAVPAISLLSR